MTWSRLRYSLLVLALLCAGCASQSAAPQAAAPTPTPGTGPRPAATATRPPLVLKPGSSAAAAPAGGTATYVWPSYVPAGMAPSPRESRVSGEKEVGNAGMGFYIVTLNGSATKLTIGGGGLDAALPLSGEQRRVTVAGRPGTLITSGDQREIVFEVPQGQLFIYSSGLSEQELLKVADSLQPVDIATLRVLAGLQ